MRYILQVNTGNFFQTETAPEAVKKRLDVLLQRLDVSEVIYGWAMDSALNRAISDFLKERGVRGFFWLPIFSEVLSPALADAFVNASGRAVNDVDNLCRGESFDFVCPTSAKNVESALETLASIAKTTSFDGVFVDRIRYPSVANNPWALLGCRCPSCIRAYEAAGVDLARLDGAAFVPTGMEEGRYTFASEDVNRLFAFKRQVITGVVERLVQRLHALGYAVGLDAFAPFAADFVGQDSLALAQRVDFLKPMMYLQTAAPAGMPFELRAIGGACGPEAEEAIHRLWGGDALSEASVRRQLALVQARAGNVAPGVDCNRIDGLCAATPDTVGRGVRLARETGCEKAVVAWDVLRMGDDMLDALAAFC